VPDITLCQLTAPTAVGLLSQQRGATYDSVINFQCILTAATATSQRWFIYMMLRKQQVGPIGSALRI